MADFEFGDFVTVDKRWTGVVIGVRFDAVFVAINHSPIAPPDVGWWNRDRLELDAGANARRRLRHAQSRIADTVRMAENQEKREGKLLSCQTVDAPRSLRVVK